MIKFLWAAGSDHKELYLWNKAECDACEQPLEVLGVHYYNRDPQFGEKVFCMSCFKKLGPEYKRIGRSEVRIAKVASELPPGAYPILKHTDVSYTTWLSAEEMEKLPSIRTHDRTVWAGRDMDLSGNLQIGMSPAVSERLRQERLDAVEQDPTMYLESERDATLLLPGQETKKLIRGAYHE